MKNKKITCIIPAYNEEKNIAKNVNLVSKFLGKEIFEIIVVNDFSSDKTGEILKNFKNIEIIENQKNLGKSKSVANAILKAKGDYIFLLDADLKNLQEKNISDFLEPILSEKSEVVMAFFKNSIPLFPFKKIDYCSGQRIFAKKILEKNIEKMQNLTNYGLEIFLNKIFIENNLSLKIIKWGNVENDFHHKKSSFLKGWKKNLKIWKNILEEAGGIFAIYKMNFDLEKLLK